MAFHCGADAGPTLHAGLVALWFYRGSGPGYQVKKLEFSHKLKIKLNDWLVCKQPIIALYVELENELKFYNLGASTAKKPYIFVIFLGGFRTPFPPSGSEYDMHDNK